MLFNSLQFLIFFPVVTTLYFGLPHRYRWALLLMASCVFYMAFIPVYILVLFVLIIIDYFMAIWIEEAPQDKKKRYLTISILATCTALFIFKYINFFNVNCQAIAHLIGWNYSLGALRIILPIGLSFHTFQSLAYIIEVYKGEQKAERNLGVYALYVMFYPQLVAGPIERPGNLLHQFYEIHHFDYRRVTDGIKLMAWGLFKKIVIADQLAVMVNRVYGHPTDYYGPALALATFFFAFQIYCDFSGYSDIAIGSAQVMGFKLMDNFNRPYSSRSISEFWKRWHISLSTWFRDYLFMPLSGSRTLKKHWYLTLFLTFVISGLWHGANWTYVIWGALNGFYLVFGIWTSNFRSNIREKLKIAIHQEMIGVWQVLATFSLICFSFIFFRAKNLQDAIYIITQLPHGWQKAASGHQIFYDSFGLGSNEFLFFAIMIGILTIVHMAQEHGSIRHMLSNKPLWIRWSVYCSLLFGMFLWGVESEVHTTQAFIYFQF